MKSLCKLKRKVSRQNTFLVSLTLLKSKIQSKEGNLKEYTKNWEPTRIKLRTKQSEIWSEYFYDEFRQ